MRQLLFDKHPLVVNPELARIVGLNEAIIAQQIHYWSNLNRKAGRNYQDSEYWTYNSYEDWQRQFPFWSKRTIIRTIGKLERAGLVISANFNPMKIDRTKWYRLNYEELERLSDTLSSPMFLE